MGRNNDPDQPDHESTKYLKKNYPFGRKVCRGCGWRHIFDFSVARRNIYGYPTALHAKCQTCRKFDRRRREGNVPRDEYLLKRRDGKPTKLTNSERARRYRAKVKADPEKLAITREYQRDYYAKRRRAQGFDVKPRKAVLDAKKRGGLTKGSKPLFLAARPMREWIERKILEYDDFETLSTLCGVSPRLIYRIMHEEDQIPFDTVDFILTREGSTQMWEIYDEESVA